MVPVDGETVPWGKNVGALPAQAFSTAMLSSGHPDRALGSVEAERGNDGGDHAQAFYVVLLSDLLWMREKWADSVWWGPCCWSSSKACLRLLSRPWPLEPYQSPSKTQTCRLVLALLGTCLALPTGASKDSMVR